MNRARQESITTEILEIVGGAEALAQAASGETRLPRRPHDFAVRPPSDITRSNCNDNHR